MEIRIDGAAMRTREAAHAEIARAMDFPAYYGRNLDALWDLLTTASARVRLTSAPDMLNALGSYGCRLLKTFYEAAEENPRLDFSVEK